jgi:hypothetical protein
MATKKLVTEAFQFETRIVNIKALGDNEVFVVLPEKMH